MKKLFMVMALFVFIAAGFGAALAENSGNDGPAPNSGDGISDGSGFDSQNGPNGTGQSEAGNGPAGPAPNSGDGDHDGSGLDSPNGPNGD